MKSNQQIRQTHQGSVSTNGITQTRHWRSGDDLLLGTDSEQEPTLSVVMPTFKLEEGIAECIEQIKHALEDLHGEVLVSDSSDNRTPEIARELDTIVVTPDRSGCGAAYQCTFERFEGEVIAMADTDTTYDFGVFPKLFELVNSVEADIIMRSRPADEIAVTDAVDGIDDNISDDTARGCF